MLRFKQSKEYTEYIKVRSCPKGLRCCGSKYGMIRKHKKGTVKALTHRYLRRKKELELKAELRCAIYEVQDFESFAQIRDYELESLILGIKRGRPRTWIYGRDSWESGPEVTY